MEKRSEYSLMELSEESGIPSRTIRYYISKNLLDGPSQVGRNAVYTEKHLVRLDEIQGLKQEGLTLHEISIGSQESDVTLGEPISWVEYGIDDDIKFSIRSDVSPWRMNLIKKTINKILPTIKKTGEKQ